MKTQIFFLLLLVFFANPSIKVSAHENVKKSIDDNRDDNGDTNEDAKDESLDIPVENDGVNLTCARRQNSQMHEIRTATSMQFPFVAAIMSHQDEYLCSGSVISNGMILTTAKCTQQPVSYVLLNASRDKKNEHTTALHIIKTEKFPTFTGRDSLKDVGIVYAEKHNTTVASKIRLSNFTSSRSLVDVEAIGYGLNAEVGQPKEMQYIGVELRSPLESEDVLRAYFDCVETKVPTCFKDTGGAAIFDNELVGIVIHGQDECTKEMSATYAINKKIADILPTFTFKAWLDEKIHKNEEGDTELIVFPQQPRRMADLTTPTSLPLKKPQGSKNYRRNPMDEAYAKHAATYRPGSATSLIVSNYLYLLQLCYLIL
ncbi:trypsin domain-containing protein [Phthorimaea operculella]|nr:trypsin domain-containing protein [Phthorimaea operculella]